MKLYVYHYHAFAQLSADNIVHMDGLTATNNPILTLDTYLKVREQIAASARDKGQAILAKELVLGSLTFIGEKDE